MTENLAKRPSKGILKSSSSFEKPDAPTRKKHKETKWDEMNIIATLHPPDKDYGHMKIEEPKTPYNWAEGVTDEPDSLDAEVLAAKIKLGAHELPKSLVEESDSEEEIEETPEEREKRSAFEFKRKAHYNEYYAVKLARQLMSTEEDDDEEDVVMTDGGDQRKAAGVVARAATADGAVGEQDSRQPSTSRSPPRV